MMMYAELELKVCKDCDKPKDKKEFRRMSRGKETTYSKCKECRAYFEFVRGLKRNYDMTPEQYSELLSKQNNSCACCGKHVSEFKRRLHVDHDHATGRVRALLCTLCNPLVGFAKENINRLEMTITYLNKFKI
jgi:hypothetical protein